MAALDWIFLAVLAFSLALGAWRGLVYELLAVANWIVAFVVAQMFGATVGDWLPVTRGAGDALRYGAGFVLTFVAALFAGGLVAYGARKLIEASGLRPVDRSLGAAFGAVRGALVLLVFALVVQMTPWRGDPWWTDSVAASVSSTALRGLKPVLPERLGQLI